MTEEQMQDEEDMQNEYVRNLNRKTSSFSKRKFKWEKQNPTYKYIDEDYNEYEL